MIRRNQREGMQKKTYHVVHVLFEDDLSIRSPFVCYQCWQTSHSHDFRRASNTVATQLEGVGLDIGWAITAKNVRTGTSSMPPWPHSALVAQVMVVADLL
jgi:hypothetical protein